MSNIRNLNHTIVLPAFKILVIFFCTLSDLSAQNDISPQTGELKGDDHRISIIKAGVKEVVKLASFRKGATVDITDFGPISIIYESAKPVTGTAHFQDFKNIQGKAGWIRDSKDSDPIPHMATPIINGIISPLKIKTGSTLFKIGGVYTTGEFIGSKEFTLILRKKLTDNDHRITVIKAGVKEVVKLADLQHGESIDVTNFGPISIIYESKKPMQEVTYYRINKDGNKMIGSSTPSDTIPLIATNIKNGLIGALPLQAGSSRFQIQGQYTSGKYLGSNSPEFTLILGKDSASTTQKKAIDFSKLSGGGGSYTFKTAHSSTIDTKLPTTFIFRGPKINAQSNFNAHTDITMDIEFVNGTTKIKRPMFFAADGNSGNSGAKWGDVWQANVCFPTAGKWSWTISAKGGTDSRWIPSAKRVPIKAYDKKKGFLNVTNAKLKSGSFYEKGLLVKTDKNYLQYENKGFFLKNSVGSPESFLASPDIADTNANAEDGLLNFSSHASNWRRGDPVWQKDKGKSIIGAINYLANNSLNCISILIDNRGTDHDNVWPYKTRASSNKFSIAKLDQWGIIFEHAQNKGIAIELVLQDSSNGERADSMMLDFGDIDKEWRLLITELAARFGHLPGLTWNAGLGNRHTIDQQKALGSLIREFVGDKAHVSIGVTADRQNSIYPRLMGTSSAFSGVSVQTNWSRGFRDIHQWVSRTSLDASPWVVNLDRIGPETWGIPVDMGHAEYDRSSTKLENLRAHYLWGTLMAGGGGTTAYFGTNNADNHYKTVDYSSRSIWWESSSIAFSFFNKYLPYTEMKAANELIGNKSARKGLGYCFAKKDSVYAIYLPSSREVPKLDLSNDTLSFEVRWYNPRSGGGLQQGSVTTVESGSKVNLGTPPSRPNADWVVLVTKGQKVESGVSIK